jgi:putative NADPH-quinone reductase
VLVVHCHPVADSLGAAARDRVLAGLARGRHDARVIDLYAEGFQPVLSRTEWEAQREPLSSKPADVHRHAEALRWAQALVLVYPTWWGGQPAMLKGWIDRVWVEGVAYTLPPGADRIRPLLRNLRRLVVVTTHGSPKRVNVLQGEPGKRVVLRQLRALCRRRGRGRWIALYGVDQADEARRRAFLDRVEHRLSSRRL